MSGIDLIYIPSISLKMDEKLRAITRVPEHINFAARCAISHQPDIPLMFDSTTMLAWWRFLEYKS